MADRPNDDQGREIDSSAAELLAGMDSATKAAKNFSAFGEAGEKLKAATEAAQTDTAKKSRVAEGLRSTLGNPESLKELIEYVESLRDEAKEAAKENKANYDETKKDRDKAQKTIEDTLAVTERINDAIRSTLTEFKPEVTDLVNAANSMLRTLTSTTLNVSDDKVLAINTAMLKESMRLNSFFASLAPSAMPVPKENKQLSVAVEYPKNKKIDNNDDVVDAVNRNSFPEKTASLMGDLAQAGTVPGSIYTHDMYSQSLLTEIMNDIKDIGKLVFEIRHAKPVDPSLSVPDSFTKKGISTDSIVTKLQVKDLRKRAREKLKAKSGTPSGTLPPGITSDVVETTDSESIAIETDTRNILSKVWDFLRGKSKPTNLTDESGMTEAADRLTSGGSELSAAASRISADGVPDIIESTEDKLKAKAKTKASGSGSPDEDIGLMAASRSLSHAVASHAQSLGATPATKMAFKKLEKTPIKGVTKETTTKAKESFSLMYLMEKHQKASMKKLFDALNVITGERAVLRSLGKEGSDQDNKKLAEQQDLMKKAIDQAASYNKRLKAKQDEEIGHRNKLIDALDWVSKKTSKLAKGVGTVADVINMIKPSAYGIGPAFKIEDPMGALKEAGKSAADFSMDLAAARFETAGTTDSNLRKDESVKIGALEKAFSNSAPKDREKNFINDAKDIANGFAEAGQATAELGYAIVNEVNVLKKSDETKQTDVTKKYLGEGPPVPTGKDIMTAQEMNYLYKDMGSNLSEIYRQTGALPEVFRTQYTKAIRRGITDLNKLVTVTKLGLSLGKVIGANAEATSDEFADWHQQLGVSTGDLDTVARRTTIVAQLTGVSGDNLLSAVKAAKQFAEEMRNAGTMTAEASGRLIQLSASAKKFGVEKQVGALTTGLTSTVGFLERVDDKTRSLLIAAAAQRGQTGDLFAGQVFNDPEGGKKMADSMEDIFKGQTGGTGFKGFNKMDPQQKALINLQLKNAYGMEGGEFIRAVEAFREGTMSSTDKLKMIEEKLKGTLSTSDRANLQEQRRQTNILKKDEELQKTLSKGNTINEQLADIKVGSGAGELTAEEAARQSREIIRKEIAEGTESGGARGDIYLKKLQEELQQASMMEMEAPPVDKNLMPAYEERKKEIEKSKSTLANAIEAIEQFKKNKLGTEFDPKEFQDLMEKATMARGGLVDASKKMNVGSEYTKLNYEVTKTNVATQQKLETAMNNLVVAIGSKGLFQIEGVAAMATASTKLLEGISKLTEKISALIETLGLLKVAIMGIGGAIFTAISTGMGAVLRGLGLRAALPAAAAAGAPAAGAPAAGAPAAGAPAAAAATRAGLFSRMTGFAAAGLGIGGAITGYQQKGIEGIPEGIIAGTASSETGALGIDFGGRMGLTDVGGGGTVNDLSSMGQGALIGAKLFGPIGAAAGVAAAGLIRLKQVSEDLANANKKSSELTGEINQMHQNRLNKESPKRVEKAAHDLEDFNKETAKIQSNLQSTIDSYNKNVEENKKIGWTIYGSNEWSRREQLEAQIAEQIGTMERLKVSLAEREKSKKEAIKFTGTEFSENIKAKNLVAPADLPLLDSYMQRLAAMKQEKGADFATHFEGEIKRMSKQLNLDVLEAFTGQEEIIKNQNSTNKNQQEITKFANDRRNRLVEMQKNEYWQTPGNEGLKTGGGEWSSFLVKRASELSGKQFADYNDAAWNTSNDILGKIYHEFQDKLLGDKSSGFTQRRNDEELRISMEGLNKNNEELKSNTKALQDLIRSNNENLALSSELMKAGKLGAGNALNDWASNTALQEQKNLQSRRRTAEADPNKMIEGVKASEHLKNQERRTKLKIDVAKASETYTDTVGNKVNPVQETAIRQSYKEGHQKTFFNEMGTKYGDEKFRLHVLKIAGEKLNTTFSNDQEGWHLAVSALSENAQLGKDIFDKWNKTAAPDQKIKSDSALYNSIDEIKKLNDQISGLIKQSETMGKDTKELTKRASTPGSIYTHDTHIEPHIIAIKDHLLNEKTIDVPFFGKMSFKNAELPKLPLDDIFKKITEVTPEEFNKLTPEAKAEKNLNLKSATGMEADDIIKSIKSTKEKPVEPALKPEPLTEMPIEEIFKRINEYKKYEFENRNPMTMFNKPEMPPEIQKLIYELESRRTLAMVDPKSTIAEKQKIKEESLKPVDDIINQLTEQLKIYEIKMNNPMEFNKLEIRNTVDEIKYKLAQETEMRKPITVEKLPLTPTDKSMTVDKLPIKNIAPQEYDNYGEIPKYEPLPTSPDWLEKYFQTIISDKIQPINKLPIKNIAPDNYGEIPKYEPLPTSPDFLEKYFQALISDKMQTVDKLPIKKIVPQEYNDNFGEIPKYEPLPTSPDWLEKYFQALIPELNKEVEMPVTTLPLPSQTVTPPSEIKARTANVPPTGISGGEEDLDVAKRLEMERVSKDETGKKIDEGNHHLDKIDDNTSEAKELLKDLKEIMEKFVAAMTKRSEPSRTGASSRTVQGAPNNYYEVGIGTNNNPSMGGTIS